MKRYVVLAGLLAGTSVSGLSQTYLSVLPSPYDVPYTFNRFGSNVYILRRADESPQSVRTAGLPPGFRGLVADPLSDWFRNPAYDPETQSLQLYGAGDDRGQILGGAMTRLDRSTLGIFGRTGDISDQTFQQNTSWRGNPASSEAGSYGTDAVSQSFEAVALYRLQLNERLALGASYQFIKDKTDKTIASSSSSIPFSRAASGTRLTTVRSTSHGATLGLQLRTGDGSLAVRARFRRSTPALHEASEDFLVLSGTRTQSSEDQATNLRTTGMLGGLEYRFSINDAWTLQTLAEIGHTTYDAPGFHLAESMYGDSVPRGLASTRGNQSLDGKILDTRIGGVAHRTVGQTFSMYGGLVFNYVKNTSDQTEDVSIVEGGISMPTLTRSGRNRYTLTAEAVMIQLPVGAEYAYSSVLRFRGGIMPQYLSVRREWRSDRFEIATSSADGSDRNRSLRFLTTMGVSLYDENIGEIHLAYRVHESGQRSWSLSARYVL